MLNWLIINIFSIFSRIYLYFSYKGEYIEPLLYDLLLPNSGAIS